MVGLLFRDAHVPDFATPLGTCKDVLDLCGDLYHWGSVHSPGVPETKGLTLESIERAHILRVLERTGWVIEGKSGAAAILGVAPSTLRSRMTQLGIRRS